MIYFDNSATTKPYDEVMQSFLKVSTEFFGNPSSLHGIGGQAEKLLQQARNQIAQLLNVKQNEIYFTSGGTEGNNLAIKGTALMYRNRGKHIITTAVEHASVLETVKQLGEMGFNTTFLPVDNDGRVSVEDIKNAITEDTFLVSVMHVNNEVGTIQPISEIGALLKGYPKVLFHVDHVQGVGKVPLDIGKSNIDLCTISGHKFHGLKGTGALYIREGVHISPLFTGGEQEWKQRSGTENVAGAVAMAKALRLAMGKRDGKLAELLKIKNFIYEELGKMEAIQIHTPSEQSAPHIINFSVKGFKAEVFVHALEEKNIYVSTTSACSSKKKSVSSTLLAMKVPDEIAQSAIRISLSYDNTSEEAIYVIQSIKEVVKQLRRVMK